jgi:hypothetical protein
MKLSTIYLALKNCSSEWIRESAKNPSKYMGKNCIKLHYLILRNRGEL